MEVPSKKYQSIKEQPCLQWTLPKNTDISASTVAQQLNSAFEQSNYVQKVRLAPAAIAKVAADSVIEFDLEPQAFVADLLKSNKMKQTALHNYAENIVVEFSSPNIAKPFHVGHLRSTIIGNVLGNLLHSTGNNVTKLNYLGDWGTQFGMLQLGVEMLNISNEQIKQNPIEMLYQAYVHANKAAKTNESIVEKAREYFTQLEQGRCSKEITQNWSLYRKYTIQELARIYDRLGVQFDCYDWESQYSNSHITAVLESLRQNSLLQPEADGRQVVVVNDRRVPVIKSDGSTLYLTRDIAALLDRHERFKFDKILYVVENGQADHFNACFQTTSKLCKDLDMTKMKHIKFGRIHGMSTRQGKVVFLKDVLDEARDIMLEKQMKSLSMLNI